MISLKEKGLVSIRYWLASLAAALLLWSVANSTSPIERPFDLPVQVALAAEDKLVVTSQNHDRVNIRVRGSRAALASLSAGALVYNAALSPASAGALTHEVDVAAIERLLPRGAEITSRAPVQIDFTLEREHTRELPVQVVLEGEPRFGFKRGEQSVFPERVTVVGARSQVRGLSRVETEPVVIEDARFPILQRINLAAPSRHVWFEKPQSGDTADTAEAAAGAAGLAAPADAAEDAGAVEVWVDILPDPDAEPPPEEEGADENEAGAAQ